MSGAYFMGMVAAWIAIGEYDKKHGKRTSWWIRVALSFGWLFLLISWGFTRMLESES